MRQDLFQNIILTDLQTIWDLYDSTEAQQLYSKVTFTLAPGADLDTVIERAKNLPVDWTTFDVQRSDRDLIGIASSADGIMSMVNTMILVTIAFSIVILTLMLFLWLHGRKREAGVMFSVGISKARVLTQFVCEMAMIAVVAFGISTVTGGAIAQAIGNNMTVQSAELARQDVMQQTGGMLAADANSTAVLKTIEQITVQADPSNLLWVFVIGMSVILIAVLISSIPQLRALPRDLLSQMK